ncbi:MAG: metallophosphoesterase [Bacteroidales bacterium]|nr:metallophosphoesterase [Candidatus Hennigimonas equi]
MSIYNYPDARSVVVCGDIHGDFHALVYKFCVQYRMTDTLLIVAGDCGFGFEKPAYYDLTYSKDAGRLRKANNWIAFIRGNHDNPAYFNEEKIAYKRWRTIPDYSVITACGHNILCIGGAVSIDRHIRISEQERYELTETGYYWPDEAPFFLPEAIDEIQLPIDTVITHTSPSFCEKVNHSFLKEWAKEDPTLLDAVAEERKTMDRICQYLKEKDMPVGKWIYAHFHQTWFASIEGTRYRMLDIMEFYEIR